MADKVIKALNYFVTYTSALEKAHLVNYKKTLHFSDDAEA